MQTQVHVLLTNEDFAVTLGWDAGEPPEKNEDLIADLWGLPGTLVVPSFGGTSLIIDGGPQLDLEEVLETLRHHGYEPVSQAVI